jgi:hypothetical protein
VPGADLGERVVDVGFHRRLADEQRGRDLGVAQAARDQPQHACSWWVATFLGGNEHLAAHDDAEAGSLVAQESILRLNATAIDYLIIALYFTFVLGIGYLAKRAVSKLKVAGLLADPEGDPDRGGR